MSARAWVAGFTILSLMGCSQTDTVSRYRDIGETRNLLTTADLRIVTARRVPYGLDRKDGHGASDHEVICTEPRPDIAKALSTLASGSASVNLNLPVAGAVVNEAGSAEGTRATAEQLAQLTERVPPIQAMRDGLYRACEAYANQVIGRNAYALILSRYGELLTTLLLASAAANEYGKQPLAKLDGVQFTVTPKPAAKAAAAATPTSAADPVPSRAGADLVLNVADNTALQAKTTPTTRPSASAGARPTGATATVLTAIGGNVPAAMEAMQFNYMRLNHVTPLLALCANNLDGSIPASDQGTAWPDREACNSLLDKVIRAEMSARIAR